jgi:hypothetical protein
VRQNDIRQIKEHGVRQNGSCRRGPPCSGTRGPKTLDPDLLRVGPGRRVRGLDQRRPGPVGVEGDAALDCPDRLTARRCAPSRAPMHKHHRDRFAM